MSNVVDMAGPEPDLAGVDEPRMEFVRQLVAGLPPARQKRLIIMAALQDVAFLSRDEARALLQEMGLRSA